MAKSNSLFKAIKRWGGNQESDALQDEEAQSEIISIKDAVDREVVRVSGVVSALTMCPRNGIPWLEAQFTDHSGEVTLIWMGRREIPGIKVGRELKVEGRISPIDGQRRIYNPSYELIVD